MTYYRHNIYIAELDAEMKVTKAPVLATQRFLNSNRNPAWSPDGQSLAYYSSRPGTGTVLVIQDDNTGAERDFPLRFKQLEIPAGITAGPPRWFPDNRSLLVVSQDMKGEQPVLGYHRVDLASGNAELLRTTRRRGNPFNRPDVSPDGKVIFHADRPGPRLLRFDIESHAVTEVKPASEAFLTAFAVSPDGAQVALTSGDSLEILPAAGGAPRELYRGSRLGNAPMNALAWTPDQRYVLLAMAEGGAEASDLWRIPVTGGAPQKVISMGIIKSPHVHPDGRRLAFGSTETGTAALWALENFLPTAAAGK